MKYLVLITLALTVPFLTGCPKTKTPMPAPIRDKLIQRQIDHLTGLVTAYENAVLAGDDVNLGKARVYRNEIVHAGLILIDDNYNQFENDLFVGRATSNIGFDLTELGVAAATGITNGERVKTILAIALTAFKGGRKSIDMNLYRERTTEVIAQKMRGSRSKVLQGIYEGLGLPVDRYPLGAAIDDLVNYVYAGSLNSAMLELAQDAGEDAKREKTKAATLKLAPFATEREKVDFNKITKLASDLKEKLRTRATEAQGRTEIEAVLKQLYTQAELGDLSRKSPEDLWNLLQDKMDEARDNGDEVLRSKIMRALNPTP
jgi:hypothetical protein